MQVALQQSLDSEQFWPALRHASPSHTPAEHDMLQQSVYEEHEAPPARHLPAGPESFEPESPPPLPLPPSPALPLLPPLPLPASVPKPLPLALLLPPQPSPEAATKGSTAKSATIAQERLNAPKLICTPLPNTRLTERYSLKQPLGPWTTM